MKKPCDADLEEAAKIFLDTGTAELYVVRGHFLVEWLLNDILALRLRSRVVDLPPLPFHSLAPVALVGPLGKELLAKVIALNRIRNVAAHEVFAVFRRDAVVAFAAACGLSAEATSLYQRIAARREKSNIADFESTLVSAFVRMMVFEVVIDVMRARRSLTRRRSRNAAPPPDLRSLTVLINQRRRILRRGLQEFARAETA